MTPPPPPRTPIVVHVALAIGAFAAALLILDGRRGWLLGSSGERGDVERAAAAPTARGAAVYVWGGGGYHGGK
ncbi:MAG: hypothetical protein R3B09_05415 [Nannocystaceae bacterium]